MSANDDYGFEDCYYPAEDHDYDYLEHDYDYLEHDEPVAASRHDEEKSWRRSHFLECLRLLQRFEAEHDHAAPPDMSIAEQCEIRNYLKSLSQPEEAIRKLITKACKELGPKYATRRKTQGGPPLVVPDLVQVKLSKKGKKILTTADYRDVFFRLFTDKTLDYKSLSAAFTSLNTICAEWSKSGNNYEWKRPPLMDRQAQDTFAERMYQAHYVVHLQNRPWKFNSYGSDSDDDFSLDDDEAVLIAAEDDMIATAKFYLRPTPTALQKARYLLIPPTSPPPTVHTSTFITTATQDSTTTQPPCNPTPPLQLPIQPSSIPTAPHHLVLRTSTSQPLQALGPVPFPTRKFTQSVLPVSKVEVYLTVEQAEARGDGSGEPRDLPTTTSVSPTTLTPTSTSSEPSIAVGDGLVAA